MQSFLDTLKKEEKIILILRRLYEKFGYKKYNMSKFEEYSLYIENKNFLRSQNIITFNDMDGKLLALKPDVTLSIAKNSNTDRDNTEKLYYIENIYRLAKEKKEYKEINQIGLELMGGLDLYGVSEVLYLAIQSLSIINPKYILDLSHMGFVASFLDALLIDYETKEKILECIRSKNMHELKMIAQKAKMPDFYIERLLKMVSISGNFSDGLKIAEEIVVNEGMKKAVDELKELDHLCKEYSFSPNLHLDFSIINDIDYYGGIIFQGYVENIPHAILSGGRYDYLMEKFGKNAGAIGFALYLDDLGRYDKETVTYDVDAVVLYEDDYDFKNLFSKIHQMREQGLRVRMSKTIPNDVRYDKVYVFNSGELEEIRK